MPSSGATGVAVGGHNGFSRGKTIFVLAVVVGCFAVLWPRIFYPMFTASLIGDSGDEVCCDVMSEKDTNAYHLMTEICVNILRRDSKLLPPLDSGQPGKKIQISKPAANLCRNEILKQCGVDVLLLLKENAAMTKEYKKSLNQIRSFNTSHCLKISYGVDVVEEIGLARMTKGPFSSPSHMRPERLLRPEIMHPALREKGQAIPSPRVPRRTIDREARPGPVPGMRPPMAQAAHVPNTPKGSGTMGIVMPMYTFGIICFFVYTLMKLISWYFMVNVTCDYVYSCLCILFKKPADEMSPPVKPQPILKDLIDPDHRKYGVYSSPEEAYPNGSERSKKVVDDYKQKEDANRRKGSGGAAAKSDTFKGRLERETVSQEEDFSKGDDDDDEKSEIHTTDSWSPNEITTTSSSYEPSSSSMEQDTMILAAMKKAVPPTLTVQPPTPSTPPVGSEVFVESQKTPSRPENAMIIELDDNNTTTTTTPGDDKTETTSLIIDNPPQKPGDERLTPEQLTSAALFFDETIEISDADFEHVSYPTGKLDASRHDGQQEDKIDDETAPVCISATPPSPQLVEYAGSLANRILADATSTVTANNLNQEKLTVVEPVVDTICVTNQETTNQIITQNNTDVPLNDLRVEPDKSNITISTNLKEDKPVPKKITPEIWKSSISQEVLEYAESLAKKILNEAKTTIISTTPPIPPKRTKRKKIGSIETKNSSSSVSSNDSPLSTPLITLIDEGRKNSEPILANQKSGLEISPVDEGSVMASGTVVDTLGGYVTLVDDEATNSMSRQKKAFLKNLGSGVEITAVEELEKPRDRSMDSNDSVITVKEGEIMTKKVEGGESREKDEVEKIVVKDEDKTLASAEVPLTPQNSIESAILDHVGIVTPPSQKPLQDSVNLTEMLLGTQSAQLSPDSNTSVLLISNETNKPVDEIAPTTFPHDSLQDQKIEILEKVDHDSQKIEILEKVDHDSLPDQKIEILEKVDHDFMQDQKIEILEKDHQESQKIDILEKVDDTNILDSERDHIASIIEQVIDQAEQVVQSRPPELMALQTRETSEKKLEENLTSPNLVEVFNNSEQQDQTINSQNIAASASQQISAPTDLLESNSTPNNSQTLLETEPDPSLDFELVEPDDAEIAAMYSFLQSVKSSPPQDDYSKSDVEFIPEVHPHSVPPITLESCTNPLKSSTLLATKTEPLVEQQSENGPDFPPPLITDKATESTLVTTSLKNELTPSQSVLTTTTTSQPDSNRSAKPNEITGDAASPPQVVTQDVLLTKPGVSDNNVSIPAGESRKEDVCSQESHPVVKAVQGILDQVSELGKQASKIETDELTKISQKNEESRSSSKPEKEVDLEQLKGSIKEEKKPEEKAKLEPERKSSVKRHPSAEKEVTFQLPEAKEPEVEDDEEEEEVEEEEEEEEPVRPPTPPRHVGSKKSKHSAAAAIALAKQASSPPSQSQHREILSVLGIEETAEMESGEKWDDRTPTPTFRMATPPVPHRAPSPPEDIPSIFLEGPLPMAGQQLMVSDSQVEMEGGDYGDDYENNTAPIILSGKVTLSVISGGGGAPDEITDASSLSYDDKGKNKSRDKTAIKAEKGLSNARKTPASTSQQDYEVIKKGFKNDEDSDDVDLTTYLTAEADNDGQNNKEDTEGDISVMGKIEELPKDEE